MKSEEKATVKFVVLQIKKPVTVWPEASTVCFYSRSPNDQVIAEFCENLFFSAILSVLLLIVVFYG